MAATVSFKLNYSAAEAVSDTMETPDDAAFELTSTTVSSATAIKIGNSWYLTKSLFS